MSMEKQKDYTLQKSRSYRSVLAAGFHLYTENFRRLFKASWLMALGFAVVCGALGTVAAIKIPEMTVAAIRQINTLQGIYIEGLLSYGVVLAALIGLVLLAIVTLALASATLLNKLKEHKMEGSISMPARWLAISTRLMGRTLKGVGLTLLLMLIPLAAVIAMIIAADLISQQFIARHIITITSTFAVVTIIALLLELPLAYVLMKYIMEAPCSYWKTLRKHYSNGMHHWSTLFLAFFVSILLVTLAALVVMMPAHILNLANQIAQMGLLMGDPLGMPTYMTLLTFVTFMLCCFIGFYVSQVTLMHNYYLYGSIEAKEKEKMKIIYP